MSIESRSREHKKGSAQSVHNHFSRFGYSIASIFSFGTVFCRESFISNFHCHGLVYSNHIEIFLCVDIATINGFTTVGYDKVEFFSHPLAENISTFATRMFANIAYQLTE